MFLSKLDINQKFSRTVIAEIIMYNVLGGVRSKGRVQTLKQQNETPRNVFTHRISIMQGQYVLGGCK